MHSNRRKEGWARHATKPHPGIVVIARDLCARLRKYGPGLGTQNVHTDFFEHLKRSEVDHLQLVGAYDLGGGVAEA